MNMKRLFGVGIGSIFIYFILSVCRMNLSTLNSLLENNMMKLFLIASFTLVLCFVSYININLERKGLYYKEYEYFPKRYLAQMMFWFGIGFNYLTPPFYQMNFQGNLLSVLFDMAFYYSMSSLCVFGILLVGKIVRKQKSKKLQESKSSNKPYFYSDNPVSNNRDDKLNREKFVNHVISSLNKINGENLTIGFYGKWGSGKTSIFKMIKEKIEDENNKDEYLIFEFKPWYFGKEDHEIIVEFLEQLLSEIRKSNGFDPKIEKNIIKYSNAFSSVSLRLPGITINLKETHSLIEELFSKKSKSIKDIKETIEELLENSDKKIVVFIDDIDRLNKEEIQTIFRLVRLICDFPNITYIVALDEEIVASALAELHGKDENVDAKKIGRDYLEKFIQIPLYIPETDVYSLNEMLWAGVREVLEENNLMERSEFLRIENSSIQRLIDLQKFEFSPRNINRYLNILKFMVPLLKDETHIDDLLYLLFIKVSAPGLYELIRVSSSELLGVNSKNNLIKEEIEKKYPGYKMVMENLFPDLRIKIPDDRDSSNKYYAIERKSRICSEDYFNRYFMYDVSESEKVLSKFFEELKFQPLEYLSGQFESFLNLYSVEKVFSVVEYNIKKFNEMQYTNVIAILQELLIKERERKFSYHEEEYVRLIAVLSIYLGESEKNPIFHKELDIWLLPRINKILNGYISEINDVSKINRVSINEVQYLIDKLNKIIREYMILHSSIDIFNKYSFKDNGEFFLLWNNIEDTEKKREIIRQWIQKKDDLEMLIPLILYPIGGEGGENRNLIGRYAKIIELVDVEIINHYLELDENSKKYNGAEYPNLSKLRNIVENIGEYLVNTLNWVIEQKDYSENNLTTRFGNIDYQESIFINKIEENLKCLEKYGSEEVQSIIENSVIELQNRNIISR